MSESKEYGEPALLYLSAQPRRGRIKRYDIEVCRNCWEDNWNGWPKEHEARITEHLRHKGLPVPVRNVFGLFPRA